MLTRATLRMEMEIRGDIGDVRMYVTCGIYALSLHSALLQIPVNVRQARRSAPGALQSAVGGWSRVARAQATVPPHGDTHRTPLKPDPVFSQNIAFFVVYRIFGV